MKHGAVNASLVPFYLIVVASSAVLVLSIDQLFRGFMFFVQNPRFPLLPKSGYQPNMVPLVPSYLATLARLATGVGLGVLLGIAAGIMSSANEYARRRYYLLFLFLAPVPPVLWARMMSAVVGFGTLNCVAVIVTTTSIVVAIATILSLKTFPEEYSAIAQIHGISGARKTVLIVIPFLIPSVKMFIRLCLLISWGTVFYVEASGVDWGAGRILVEVYNTANMPATIVISLALVCTAIALDFLVARLCTAFSSVPKWIH